MAYWKIFRYHDITILNCHLRYQGTFPHSHVPHPLATFFPIPRHSPPHSWSLTESPGWEPWLLLDTETWSLPSQSQIQELLPAHCSPSCHHKQQELSDCISINNFHDIFFVKRSFILIWNTIDKINYNLMIVVFNSFRFFPSPYLTGALLARGYIMSVNLYFSKNVLLLF